MKIWISVKSAQKRTNFLTDQQWTLPERPYTLRELLCELTCQMVKKYRAKAIDADLVSALTAAQIESGLEHGKVGFDRRYGPGEADVRAAQAAMLLAFEDGLFRVFHGCAEWTALDAPAELRDGERLILVRLVMLSGSLFPYIP